MSRWQQRQWGREWLGDNYYSLRRWPENWKLNNDEELEQGLAKQKEEQVQNPKMEINMVSLRKRRKAVSAGPQEMRDRVVV